MKITRKTGTVVTTIFLCLLVGFVLGAAYGLPGERISSKGVGAGNVSALSKARLNEQAVESGQEQNSDTLEMSAVDAQGRSWNIKMVNTTKQ